MKKNILVIILVIILTLELGVISLNYFSSKKLENLPIEIIQGSMVYDMTTPEKAIGAVDNVFVGKIVARKDTIYDENDIPTTIYEVEVKENIKGNLITNNNIELYQIGGINKNNTSYTFYENTNYLEENEEYIILAFVPFEKGNLIIHNQFTYINLNSNKERTANDINLLETYKEAYQNQEVPESKKETLISKYEEK